MRGSGKQFGSARERQIRAGSEQVTTKGQGDRAEAAARAFLQRQGLRWVQSNFRTPGRGGGEIDLIMRDTDGTLVFVEVRQRSRTDFGGAGGSIGGLKRRRIVFAARHYLMRLPSPPPCRFDVVLIDGGSDAQAEVSWFKAAFDAS
jgi:putative endonuclease